MQWCRNCWEAGGASGRTNILHINSPNSNQGGGADSAHTLLPALQKIFTFRLHWGFAWVHTAQNI